MVLATGKFADIKEEQPRNAWLLIVLARGKYTDVKPLLLQEANPQAPISFALGILMDDKLLQP